LFDMSIKVLDPRTVSQIAAGEVVERPASAVKELVENSLDAGANQISVEVAGGGINLIRVVDNGEGILLGEVELAFKRHATSKLHSIGDLASVSSLGFRGEALPSISAVAQVEMVTCARGHLEGTRVSLEDGMVKQRGSQSRSVGTTVTVRQLFRKIPARLKFLKSSTTENSHIANVVGQYALAYPEVKFTLSIDGRNTLRTPGSGRLVDSVAQVYGLDIAQNMLPVEDTGWESGAAGSTVTVSGMVGSPTVSRSNRGYLSFFVNRRWITSRSLAWAVEEAYHGLLMQGRHPVVVLDIALSPDLLDVNIHPTKTEVKFQHEHAVFVAVQKAVRHTLVGLMPVPMMEEAATAYRSPMTARPVTDNSSRSGSLFGPSPMAPMPAVTPAASLPVLRVLGQVLSSYIVAEGPEGLYLIDQHAAHERIMWEKISTQRQQSEIEVQGLLEPVTLEVSPRRNEALRANYEKLTGLGFNIEPFGDRTYLVRAVPALLHDRDWKGVLLELMDAASGEGGSDWAEKATISMACHSAVRAGQALTESEMRELVRELEQADVPNTCPHGRPTMIQLSAGQLRKQFGRE